MTDERRGEGPTHFDAVLAELRRPTAGDPALVDRIMERVAAVDAPERQRAGHPPRGALTRPLRMLAVAAALAAVLGTATAMGWGRGDDALSTVRFEVRAPGATRVSVVGDFNDWLDGRTPLDRVGEGVWAAEVALPAGRYEYAFRVDGSWRADDEAPSAAADEFGAANSVLVVSEASQ